MVTGRDLREQSKNLNVLYAEDEDILRESMQTTLKKIFKNAYVTSNGQEAFEIYKKEDIDIVITDINMPIMDGVELINNIYKYEQENTMVVVLSAHNESRLLSTLINLGVDSFLNKPLDKQRMINSLYKVCKIVNDRKLLIEYETKLEDELDSIERKNKVLEGKLNQLAHQTNKNIVQKEVAKEVVSISNYFTTLLADDKDELEDLSIELANFIAMMFQGEELNEDYLYKLANSYKKYATILNTYLEFYDVATFLNDFSESMLNQQEKFMKDLNQTGIYFESLQFTLENYRQNVWQKEAKNPRFYNASLINDIQLIIDFLEDKEIQNSEIEFF
ncbi:MAG: response regulator [Campylobacterota bacterium]|nr:response regulator [Campylobacterota bacterium]